jgi:hypothetical protein
MWRYGLDGAGSGKGQVAGTGECGNNFFFYISGFHIVVLFNLSKEMVYIYRLTQLS